MYYFRCFRIAWILSFPLYPRAEWGRQKNLLSPFHEHRASIMHWISICDVTESSQADHKTQHQPSASQTRHWILKKMMMKRKKNKRKSLIRLNVSMNIMSIHTQYTHSITDLMKITRKKGNEGNANHVQHILEKHCARSIDKIFMGFGSCLLSLPRCRQFYMSNEVCIIIGKRRRSLWSVIFGISCRVLFHRFS